MNLYEKHRPKSFDEVLGNDGAIKVLKGYEKKGFPHAMMFSGPSGTGKTTLARIIADKVKAFQGDYKEINSAEFRGIDSVRDIMKKMNLGPIYGESRFYLFDECHKMTNDAQNAMLKMLENPPEWVYFALCTTDADKMINAIMTRCTEIKTSSFTNTDAVKLLNRVSKKIKFDLDDDVRNSIIESSEGSPRKLLVILESISNLKSKDEQLEGISIIDSKSQIKELCQFLLSGQKDWPRCAKILKNLDEDPERVRHAVLGYMNAVLLNSGKARCFDIISAFERNFYDGKKAALTAVCYHLCRK